MNCDYLDYRIPKFRPTFQQTISPRIENFVLKEGQIFEESSYCITRDTEFVKVTSEREIMEDYFSFS